MTNFIEKGRPFLDGIKSPQLIQRKEVFPMNQFTTEIIEALVKKQDITEVFRSHLETDVNTLLAT